MSLSLEMVSGVDVEEFLDPKQAFDHQHHLVLKASPINNGHSNSPSPTEELEETESSDTPEPLNLHEANMVNGEDWNHITKPGEHDVLLGRGGGTNNHVGNIRFRKLVNEHKMRYLACSKVDKPKVARQVVALWRKLEPPGRFLTRKDETKRGPGSVKAQDNVWYEVGDKKAREKASQCLRERTPDVIPYIKHLREQQNAITEQGVSFVQMQMQQHEQQPSMMNGGVAGGMNLNHAFRAPPQQVMHPQAMPHHPAVMSHHHQNFHPNNGYFDPSQQQQCMPNQQQFQMQQQQSMQPQAFPRRNSCPSQAPHPFSANDRRGSMQPAAAPSSMAFINNNNNNSGAVDPFGQVPDPSEMTEMEYQQHIMMMQQQMQMQQLQMQRLQQSRMQATMQRMNSLGDSHNEDPSQHYSQQQQQSLNHQDLPLRSESSNPGTSPLKRYRSVGKDDNIESKNNNDRERVAPDRAISLMSLTPANPSDDNELSLEDYRQQLEEYIANTGHGGSGGGGGDGGNNENKKTTNSDVDPSHTEGDEDDDHQDGNESDLEDDWEKEREKAIQQAQASQQLEKRERGVNRNVSGMSFQSTGGMSLVSGFSGFTDMMNVSSAREKKMDMARSACSNLSLMSELTDLSQNIDNLSLYDG